MYLKISFAVVAEIGFATNSKKEKRITLVF